MTRHCRIPRRTWIASAKKPQTRARRIAETARLAAMNVRVNQQWALKGAKGRREG